jgi:hypothetical protein
MYRKNTASINRVAQLALSALLLCITLLASLPAPHAVHAQPIAPPSTCSRQQASPSYIDGTSGGDGGDPFTDTGAGNAALTISLPDTTRVRGVIIQSGNYVDGIQLVYILRGQTVSWGYHGGAGGDHHEFWLDSDEYITGIEGRSGAFVDSLIIHTNKRSSPQYGGDGGANAYSYDVPPKFHVMGFWGRSGDYIDSIGIEYRQNC